MLIGALGTAKNKAIKIDLPGLAVCEVERAEGGRKRKRAEAGEKHTSTSKRGGHGHGAQVDLRLIRCHGEGCSFVGCFARVDGKARCCDFAGVMAEHGWGLYLAAKCQVSPICPFSK